MTALAGRPNHKRATDRGPTARIRTLFSEPFAPLFEFSRQMAGDMRPFVPTADVVVTDDDVTVVMDVPCLKADDVTIELRDDVLTVGGERPLPYQTDGDGAKVGRHIERGFGSFERVLRLPAGLDPDAVSASLTDGVVTLHIPKPQEHKPRRIEITNGHNGTAIEQRELAGATA